MGAGRGVGGAIMVCLKALKVPRNSPDESGVRPEDVSQIFVSPLYPVAKRLSASGKGSQTHLCDCGKTSKCQAHQAQGTRGGNEGRGLPGGRREQRVEKANTQEDCNGITALKIVIMNHHGTSHHSPCAVLIHSADAAFSH